MARLSVESRKRVIALLLKGHSVIEIHRRLQEENICISRQGLHNLLLKFQVNGIVADLPRRRRHGRDEICDRGSIY